MNNTRKKDSEHIFHFSTLLGMRKNVLKVTESYYDCKLLPSHYFQIVIRAVEFVCLFVLSNTFLKEKADLMMEGWENLAILFVIYLFH